MIGDDEYLNIYQAFGATLEDKQFAAGKPVAGSLAFTDTVCPSDPNAFAEFQTQYLGTPIYCEQNGAIVIAGFHQGEYTRDNDDNESQALWCDKPAKFADVWFNMQTQTTTVDEQDATNMCALEHEGSAYSDMVTNDPSNFPIATYFSELFAECSTYG